MMIASNHEFYNDGDIAAQGESWQKMFLPNVGYYHNKVVRIDNVDFILSTLWSRIPPVDEITIQSGMNDYVQILYNKRRLIPQNINDEFERNFAFIKQSVDVSDAEKIVVVTHHLPTFAVIEEKHKGSVLNAAYATELGNTHLVSNPLGYVFCGENTAFNDSAVMGV